MTVTNRFHVDTKTQYVRERRPAKEQLKHAFLMQNHQIDHLSHTQVSRYYKLWILATEALMFGLGVGFLAIGGYFTTTRGISAAIDAIIERVQVGFASVLVVTVLLRVV